MKKTIDMLNVIEMKKVKVIWLWKEKRLKYQQLKSLMQQFYCKCPFEMEMSQANMAA